MPWSVQPVSEIRMAFVHQVLTLKRPVAQACREFAISRKTGYKWINRYREAPTEALVDRSRRPARSPHRTSQTVQEAVLEVRDQFGWGPRKIHAYLRRQKKVPRLPSPRTVANILRRCGRVVQPAKERATPQFFQRSQPHELWQCDFKGPIEVARQRVHPLTVLDDHSRYLLALKPCFDLTMKSAFAVLWNAFGEFGLPDAILCDNAFGTLFTKTPGVGWFESQLIRLEIRTIHGRPYHPQTQGKVERLHGTLEREVWPFVRRDSLEHFDSDLQRWRMEVYNRIRPHESLGDAPPITHFKPSPRPRPTRLPDVQYPTGSVLRKVGQSGDVRWNNYRILAGRGIVGQYVRIEERDHDLVIFFAAKQIRCLSLRELRHGTML